MRLNSSFGGIVVSAVLLFGAAFAGGAQAAAQWEGRFVAQGYPAADKPEQLQSEPLHILIAGLDQLGTNTDVIMALRLDGEHQTLRVLSIPRDTRVTYHGHTRRINSFYSSDGPQALEQIVEDLTGFAADRYVIVELSALIELIDLLGGVDFDVPQNMNYDDPTQNLSIHLKAGMQHLDGQQVMELIRFRRYPMGDLQRIQVQQSLLAALIEQKCTAENLSKLKEIYQLIADKLETDLDAGDFLSRLGQLAAMLHDGVDARLYSLPGSTGSIKGASYYFADREQIATVMAEFYQ